MDTITAYITVTFLEDVKNPNILRYSKIVSDNIICLIEITDVNRYSNNTTKTKIPCNVTVTALFTFLYISNGMVPNNAKITYIKSK